VAATRSGAVKLKLLFVLSSVNIQFVQVSFPGKSVCFLIFLLLSIGFDWLENFPENEVMEIFAM